jgi:16S rRNA (cytosine967-C5)-methyltransferase
VTVQKPREIAARALLRRENGADYIENILAADLENPALRADDRSLAMELTYGVVRWQAALDWLIARKTGGRTQKQALQILLRLGLYQIFWLDRIPDHAAVHETVELGKQLGCGPQAGFINAVLRGCLREKPATLAQLKELKTTNPSAGFSHPDWLRTRWEQRWGAANAALLMDWNNTPPRIFARVNTLKVEPAKLIEAWRGQENVDYDFFNRPWLEENLVFQLKSHPPIESLASFRDGWFYVQDPSTLLSVCELDPQPGEKVLDLCAAPGGKATFAAQRMRNEGSILAQDDNADRLRLVTANCERLGVTCVQTEMSAEIPKERTGFFDRVILDAPCSNTGVLRRRVDLRWRVTLAEVGRLRATQLRLLQSAAAQLKPGGTLVYSTCSLEPEENGNVIREFLGANQEFSLERERELLPFTDGVDGAYIARLVRVTAKG